MTYKFKLFIFILFFNFSQVHSQSLEDQYKNKRNQSEIFNKALSNMKSNLSGFSFYKCSESAFMSELSSTLLAIKNNTIAIHELNAIMPSEDFELFQDVRFDNSNGYQFSKRDMLSSNQYQIKFSSDLKTGVLYNKFTVSGSSLPTSKMTCVILSNSNNINSGKDNDRELITINHLFKGCNIENTNINTSCKLLVALYYNLRNSRNFEINDKIFSLAAKNTCLYDVVFCFEYAAKFVQIKDNDHSFFMIDQLCEKDMRICTIVGSMYSGKFPDPPFTLPIDYNRSYHYFSKGCNLNVDACKMLISNFITLREENKFDIDTKFLIPAVRKVCAVDNQYKVCSTLR
jgi:hypothetical protein